MSLLDHSGNNSFGNDKGCIQIHINYLTELIRAHLQHRNTLDNTGIVYQDINNANLFLNLLNHVAYRRFVGNVAHIAVGLNPFFLIGSNSLIHQFLLNVIENDGSSCLCVSRRNSEANAVGCSRYQCHFAFQ